MDKVIKIKYFIKDITPITKIDVGDWIDLRVAEPVKLKAGESKKIRLGVGMILPTGYEAYIVARSSTYDKYGIILANGLGVIDNSYSGDGDEWTFNAIALRKTEIPINTRIAQFRIMSHQPQISFDVVSQLNDKNRGGYGSTGEF